MNGIILACLAIVAHDGDSPLCDGILLRDMGPGKPFVSGFDTPEIERARCDRERMLGEAARDRYQQLLDRPGTYVVDSGKRDQFDRPLVWVLLSDRTPAGTILLKEWHAVPWPNDKDWCDEQRR